MMKLAKKKKLIPKKAAKRKLHSSDPEVAWVPIESVKPWKNNPMGHDPAGVETLAKILQRHGQRTPIEVWRKNMTIYKGNGTYAAMKKNGATEIKVQFNDFESEAAANAYGIADNRASELSQWDVDTLTELLSAEEIAEEKEFLGFTDSELQGLSFEPDSDKIDNLKEAKGGIKATIKIICKPEDRDEVRDVLAEWAKDSGFEGVVLK